MAPKKDDKGTASDQPLGGTQALGQRVDDIEHTLTRHGDATDDMSATLGKTSQQLDAVLEHLKLLSPARTSSDSDRVTVQTDSDSARTSPVTPMTPSYSGPSTAAAGRSSISFADGDGTITGPPADGLGAHVRPHLQVKADELTPFDGTQEQTELFISDLKALLESEPEPAYVPALERAIVRAIPRVLRGAARLWHSTMDSRDRAKLTTLGGKHGWIAQLRANFSATPAVVRQQARARVWNPDQETVLHYTFAKVALMKVAWAQMDDNDCITDIVDGVPLDMRQLLRVPMLRSPHINELRDELRTQETYWREQHQRPLLPRAEDDGGGKTKGSPSYNSLLQPAQASSAATFVQRPSPVDGRRAGATFSRSRRGKSIRDDFDPARLFYGPHPHTGKRTMAYKIPETDEIMWCNRACRTCKGDHFDFAHDHCSTATVHLAEPEDDYPVTHDDGVYSSTQGF